MPQIRHSIRHQSLRRFFRSNCALGNNGLGRIPYFTDKWKHCGGSSLLWAVSNHLVWYGALETVHAGDSIFHVGCGTGYYTAIIAERLGSLHKFTIMHVCGMLTPVRRVTFPPLRRHAVRFHPLRMCECEA
jgi:hypothetical protein